MTTLIRPKSHLLIFTLILGAAVASSPVAGAQQGMGTQTVVLGAPSGPVVLGPGDLIEVSVFNTPELSGRLRVDSAGRVTLPVGGQVDLSGMTVLQAGAAIAERLRSSQVMLNPSVTVSAVESATLGVTVLGEVRKPGTYPLLGTHSLYDALAVAGGGTDEQGATIKVSHPGDPDHPEVIQVNGPDYSSVQKATVVKPGDTVYVAKADVIYVVGDVVRGGSYNMGYGQHLTILNAISLAQGANRTAAMSRGAIVRKAGDGAQTIQFDLNKVMTSQEPNLALQAGDVVVIPRSGFKTFAYIALPGIINAAAYAGAQTAIDR